MTFVEEVIKLRSENKYLRIENANLKRRNDTLTKKVLRLEEENRTLRQENHLLREKQLLLVTKQEELEKQLESVNLIVEELRRMVFGKKKASGGTEENGSGQGTATQGEQPKKQRKMPNRSKESYRRVAPQESAVTATHEHPLTHCPECGTLVIRLKQIVRYTEDIVSLTQLATLLKKIEKHVIGSGYCPKCKRRKVAKVISPQVSILGENVKQLVCYLSIIMRQSFEQIRCFLKDTADLALSDGEITACLDEQAEKLVSEKDRLLTQIRGAPGRHYDETGWKVQQGGQGNYAWITRPTIGEETILLMGRSRGKGNAEELRGIVDTQVGISDDYGAYTNLPCINYV